MRKSTSIFTAILILLSTNVFSQQPNEMVANIAGRTITIDGDDSDLAWSVTMPVSIDLPYSTEQPSLNSATWKAIWDTAGIYILIEVSDDVWSPSWVSGLDSWQSDKVELYIDVTDPQKDGGGASGGNGNYQVAPDFPNNNQGIRTDFDGAGTVYAGVFDGSGNYTMEYYIPFSAVPTNNGDVIDPYVTTTIGFDPTIIDLDDINAARNRAVWANTGGIDESWNNMDNVGLITFVQASDELRALFSADKRTTGPGKDIQFTDFSNGTPTTWLWNFGDGNTSTDQNPIHSYASMGEFTVSLMVTDEDDSNSYSAEVNYISITADALEPTTQFSVSNQEVSTDEIIQFSDESLYDPNSWTWYFGDGAISTEQNPSHYYTSAGTYTVVLATSNENGSDTKRKVDYITVTSGLAPVADFSVNTSSVLMDEAVQFTDKTLHHPTKWEWDFGDGNESTLQNPEHIYTRAGIFDVSLEVENSSGTGFTEKTEFVVVVATPLSANSVVSNGVNVFPNPSQGFFTVNLEDISLNEGKLIVYTLNGKVLMTEENLVGNVIELNLSNHSKGMYFLQIQEQNFISTHKLIIE